MPPLPPSNAHYEYWWVVYQLFNKVGRSLWQEGKQDTQLLLIVMHGD
jgi:hypothetical protein